MTQEYISQYGQSIYDICLNTYGTLDLLVKLMVDNNFPSVDQLPPSQSVFVFDDTLVLDQTRYTTSGVLVPYSTWDTGIGVPYFGFDGDSVDSIPVGVSRPTPVGSQLRYDGIIDDGHHYDLNFIDAFR